MIFRTFTWGRGFLEAAHEGRVTGERLAYLSVSFVDSNGRAIESFDRVQQVENYLAAATNRATPATIDWRVKVKGERLVLAKFPITVTAAVTNTADETARFSITVDR